jgi:hypothetical protein
MGFEGLTMAKSKDEGAVVNVEELRAAREKELADAFGQNVKVNFAYTPIKLIRADDDYNMRFAAGQSVGDIKIENDTRDIPGMVSAIKLIGLIQTPLEVSKRADGTIHLLRGFRRYNAANLIRLSEPGTELATRLETLPTMVYEGLTPEQEIKLINDQTQKDFSAGEVYRFFRDQLKKGYNWEQIAAQIYTQIARVTGASNQLRKVDTEPDPVERRKILKRWLNGTANQFWACSVLAGPKISDMVLHTYLYNDGYTKTKPQLTMTGPKMVELWREVKLDREQNEWDYKENMGPRTRAKIEELIAKENPKSDDSGDISRNKLKRAEVIKGMVTTNSEGGTTLTARILMSVFENNTAAHETQIVNNFDRCRQAYMTRAKYLKPEVAELCRWVFDGGDNSEKQFDKFLVDNYSDEPVEETQGEPTQGELIGDSQGEPTQGELIGTPTEPTGSSQTVEVVDAVPVDEMTPEQAAQVTGGEISHDLGNPVSESESGQVDTETGDASVKGGRRKGGRSAAKK